MDEPADDQLVDITGHLFLREVPIDQLARFVLRHRRPLGE
jgi:hypothetical protein